MHWVEVVKILLRILSFSLVRFPQSFTYLLILKFLFVYLFTEYSLCFIPSTEPRPNDTCQTLLVFLFLNLCQFYLKCRIKTSVFLDLFFNYFPILTTSQAKSAFLFSNSSHSAFKNSDDNNISNQQNMCFFFIVS